MKSYTKVCKKCGKIKNVYEFKLRVSCKCKSCLASYKEKREIKQIDRFDINEFSKFSKEEWKKYLSPNKGDSIK